MSDKKSYLEDIGNPSKPESFSEEVFVKAPFNYKPIIFLTVIVLLVAATIVAIQLMNRIQVPDYSEWTIEEFKQWTDKNELSPVYKDEYTLEHKAGTLMSVSVDGGETISKKDSFTVVYSTGPDPTQQIELIDFKGISLSEVNSFIERNKATSISVKKEYNTLIPKDTVINYEFKDGSFDNYLRKNRMTIYVSQGPEEVDATVKMPDLVGKTKGEILDWASKENFQVELNYQFNETFDYDKAYAQDIKADTKITRSQVITVSISKGTSITVPDFNGLDKSQVEYISNHYDIDIFFKYKVSSLDADIVLSQDIDAGTIIDGKTIVTLTMSKESNSYQVPDFIALSESEASSLASLNSMSLFIKSVDSIETKGKVIGQSIEAGGWAKKDAYITLEVSNGLISAPDFVGLDRQDVDIESKRLGIDVIYREVETYTLDNDNIIGQDIAPGQTIHDGDSIVCDVVVNSGIYAKDLGDMSAEEARLWASSQGITLNVVETYNNDNPAGKIFAQDIKSRWIGKTEVVTAHVSLGKVVVIDYIGRTKVDVVTWANEVNQKGADLRIVYKTTKDTKEKRGTITDQSTVSDYIPTGTSLLFTVSATNEGIIIPSLEGMTYDDFLKWAQDNEINYSIEDAYSSKFATDTIIDQNYKNENIPKNKVLKVKKSIGNIELGDYTGDYKLNMERWASSVNLKGAKVELIFTSEFSDTVEQSKIISHSPVNDTVTVGSKINVIVSKGPDPSTSTP